MSTDDLHVVAVCGSLADESATRFCLKHALAAAERGGVTTDLVDLRGLEIPVFDADIDTDDADDAGDLVARIERADAVILGTPMYHGSYSSPLKTVLDYCGFYEFEGTTVGLLAVSGGSFPITALDHLRSVLRALDAWVLPFQAAVPRSSSAIDFEAGEFTKEDHADRVATLGRRVVEYANIEPDPTSFEGEQNIGAENK